ncbi:hypothetical protein ACNQR7_26930 [Mycolicibacterium senegalense]|uniref:hypothetical protein n=2 Tax=Mycobacteriaceae TaxID=1762 RepID=UPI003AAB329B
MTCPAPADNTSQTWRDLAGQQITQIEWAEVALVDGPEKEATLLGIARDVIDRRRIDAELADVALPPGARTDSEGWGKGLTEDGYSRSLLWREYAAGAVVVAIDGDQQSDGSFTRQISLYAGDGERLDADGARALGAALIEAADALEAPL